MMPLIESAYRHSQLGLLRGASLMVPASEREEWWREWRAELWHIRRECVLAGSVTWQAEYAAISFCLGAFHDALCLRRYSLRDQPLAALAASPAQCLFWLTAVLTASCAVALLAPAVRTVSHPARYQVNPGLMLIQDARTDNDSAPTISVDQYRYWKARSRRYFDGFAFYWIGRETMSTASDTQANWEVAHASSNLFALLGSPIWFRPSSGKIDSHLPQVILSYEAWKRNYGGNPNIVGGLLRVGAQLAIVGGVIPDGAWRLPGKIDAWLLQPDSEIASGGMGHVVAHLKSLGKPGIWAGPVHISALNPDDSVDDLWGVSFKERTQGPWNDYLFAVFLAFLALPAVTSISMSEYCFSSHRPSWSARLFRWGFLIAKVALVLAIAYFSSLDLAYLRSANYSLTSEYVQLISCFSISLFGIRWALLDQHQRCPECLRRVSNPARVGLASRTFLAWNGTELICSGGHTVLHIPGLPTSWFNSQRWLYLDTSWKFLFARPGNG